MSRIFIKNLPRLATEDDLRQHFHSCGNITDVQIAHNQDGVSRQFGFVGFADQASAEKALLFEGSYIKGRKIIIQKAVSHSVAEKNKLKPEQTRHLSTGAKAVVEKIINENDDLLKQYLNQQKGWNDGVVAAQQPKREDDQASLPQAGEKPEQQGEIDEQKIKLLNVPEVASEEQIRSHFASFGAIKEVTICNNLLTKKPTGVVFITFELPESAKRAVVCEETQFLGKFLQIKQARTSPIADFIQKKEYKAKGFDKNNKLAWNPIIQRQSNVIASLKDQLGDLAQDVNANAVTMAAAEAFVQKELQEAFAKNCLVSDQNSTVQRSNLDILCKNVPIDVEKAQIQTLFEQFGVVASVNKVFNGFFLVKMAQPGDCKRAFAKLAFKKVGKEKAPLMLEFARIDPALATAAERKEEVQQKYITIYTKNVSFATTVDEITAIITQQLQSAIDLQIPQNEVNHKGFFFLSVPEAELSQSLQVLNAVMQNGYKWVATQAKMQKNIDFSTKLVVKNLAFQANQSELRDLLQQFGRITSLRCPKKLDGGLRGFAFAEFATAREAKAAAEGVSGVHFYGRKLICEVGKDDAIDGQEQQ